MQTEQLYAYRVWDLPTRLFHRINFAAVITRSKYPRARTGDADEA